LLGLIEENTTHMSLIVLVANNCNITHWEVGSEKVATFCKERELSDFITSALTGQNVRNAADHMTMTLAGGLRKKVDQQPIGLAPRR
jgi:hypothetical protein